MAAPLGAYLRATVVNDAGSEIINNIPNTGWGMFIIGDTTTPTYPMDADDETIGVALYCIANGGGVIYTPATMLIQCITNCFPQIKCLAFVGDLGEETFIFRGLHTETGEAEKTYYKNANRIRKVLRAFKKINLKLRTLHEGTARRRLLNELVHSESDVWMYVEDAPLGYRSVTVIDNDIVIGDRNELFESSIDVEYYE